MNGVGRLGPKAFAVVTLALTLGTGCCLAPAVDASVDAGGEPDAGVLDAGPLPDAGSPDAGTDAGRDGGPDAQCPPSPGIVCTPTPLSFGTQLGGSATRAQLTCANPTVPAGCPAGELLLGAIVSTNSVFQVSTDSSTPLAGPIAAGGEVLFDVDYLPSASASCTGADTGTVTISTNVDGEETVVVPLEGRFQNLQPCQLFFQPAEFDFGNLYPVPDGGQLIVKLGILNINESAVNLTGFQLSPDLGCFQVDGLPRTSVSLDGGSELSLPITVSCAGACDETLSFQYTCEPCGASMVASYRLHCP